MTHLRNVALAVSVVGLVACGGSPALIDQTDPNFVRKADLLNSSWYMLETVVDVPPTTSITFVGLQGGLEKVRFEIQRDKLVAYRAYERVPGSDPLIDREKSVPGNLVYKDGTPYKGAPVAAWTIVSHFDRQREYNAGTGQQSNVLEENTTDHAWYDRQFMRVNWASPLVVNHESFGEMLGKASLQSFLPRDVGTDADDVVVFDYAEAETGKTLQYFDITTRQYWDPAKEDLPGYGTVPYCWMDPRVDCETALVKVRSSFKRVDSAHVQDFQPLVYDDKLQTKFGFFRTEHVTYDRNRGVTETGRILLANHHNIWEKSHDENGAVIPVHQRTPRPLVYHLSTNYPKTLLESAKNIEASWDMAFRRAVAVPRGQKPEQSPKMFYMCETPVPEDAPAACGKAGTSPRLGDLRYNMLVWVDSPQLAGPLGYGPSSADPETGEIIQGAAYMYGAAVDTQAAESQVLIDVINKELPLDEFFKTGQHVRDFISLNFAATDPRRPVTGPWTGTQQQPLSTAPGVARAAGSFGNISGRLRAVIETASKEKTLPRFSSNRREVVSKILSQNAELQMALVDNPEVRAFVLSTAPGDSWRQRLLSDPTLYRDVARETILRVDELQKMHNRRVERASKNNVWLAEFSDDAVVGIAKELAELFNQKKAEFQRQGNSATAAQALAKTEIYNHIRNVIFRGVAEHEVGHTVGLMHNFIGSFDAMNYPSEYWSLRKQTLGVTINGQKVLPTAPENLAKAWQMNASQANAKMREYQSSSIMDYGPRFNSRTQGIGRYDEAAVLFAYAGGGEPGWVEVFRETRATKDPAGSYNDPNNLVQTDIPNKQMVIRGAHVELPYSTLTHYTPMSAYYSDKFHYSTLPFHFAEKGLAFDQAVEQGISRMQNRTYKKWSDMKVVYDDLQTSMDRWNVTGGFLQTSKNWEIARAIILDSKKGKGAPVEVPYMFCSDYEVGANPACNRWDMGADIYEITADWMARYNEYYAFTNFKRDRYGFNPSSVVSRNFGRLMGNFPNIYQNWLFDIYFYQSFLYANPGQVGQSGATSITPEVLEDVLGFADPITQNYTTMAVIDSTNLLLQQLATPAAGYYGKDKTTGRWVLLNDNNVQSTRFSAEEEARLSAKVTATGSAYSDIAYVPRGPGRSMYTLFDNDGYDFYTRTQEVGHFWDQYAALNAVTSSETNFLGVDRGADAYKYSLPYYMTFPKELAGIFGNVWAQRPERYGASLVKANPDDRNLADVVPSVYIHGQDFIYGFNYPANPVYPPKPTATLEKVDASPTWGSRFYTGVYGMAYFNDNMMFDYANENKIFRLGTGESVTPATGFELVSFQDPFGGGYSYSALRKVGETNPTTAALMVETANDYRAKWIAATTPETKALWETKTREAVRTLEMMRGLYAAFGEP